MLSIIAPADNTNVKYVHYTMPIIKYCERKLDYGIVIPIKRNKNIFE